MKGLILKYAWYPILVGIGLLFRYSLLVKYDDIRRKHIMLYEIMIVMFISCILSNDEIINDKESLFVAVFLPVVYCVYNLIKKIPKGYTESELLLVNGYLVTALSFCEFPENIFVIVLIVLVSIGLLKFAHMEKKSDFLEIVFLCVELLLVSYYMYICKIDDSIEIMLVVLFVETVLYTFNCIFKYFLIWICKEDTDNYWNELMGFSNDYR